MCLAGDDECVGEKFGLCPNRRAEDVYQDLDRAQGLPFEVA